MDKDGYGLVQGSAYQQGYKCCGCCCDVRRAVIIVNVANIVISVFVILEFIGLENLITKTEEQITDDDEAAEELHNLAAIVHNVEGFREALMVVRIMGSAAGIYGAKTFQWKLVAVSGSVAVYAVAFVPDIYAIGLIAGPVIDIFFAYPHLLLIKK
mmetsp:Transcript_27309/g.40004  ORF Transcript_27309/g.40004 Transcript_27309/m.40004 type:complete len:156 (-) Transcript_27309:297-764(-)